MKTAKFTHREWQAAILQATRQHGKDCLCTTCQPHLTPAERQQKETPDQRQPVGRDVNLTTN